MLNPSQNNNQTHVSVLADIKIIKTIKRTRYSDNNYIYSKLYIPA